MKNFNKVILLAGCLAFASGVRAQESGTTVEENIPAKADREYRFCIGPKMDLTAGDIRSANFQNSLDAQRVIDPNITTWTSQAKPGPGIGIGAFATFRISKGFHLLGELTFSDEMSKYDFTYQNSTLNPNGNNRIIDVNSEFKLNTYSFQLPMLVKYELKGENGVYFIGGVRLSLIASAKMMSDETRTTDHYNNYVLAERSVENSSMTTTLDGYGTARWAAVGGVGYALALAGHPLLLDLRINLPLSRSGYYTTDVFYQENAFENGRLFGAAGKTASETQTPQYPFNDFRDISFGLSASYALFVK